MLKRQRIQVDRWHTTQIDRTHGRTIRVRALGKGFRAALLTKTVIDFMGVEFIRAKRIAALYQGKLFGRKEGQQKTFPSAMRAIATYSLCWRLGIDFKPDRTAMAASFKRHSSS